MDEPRLKTDVYIAAIRRHCDAKLLTATVYAVGDDERGGLVLRVARSPDSVMLYEQARGHDGGRLWRMLTSGPISERESTDKLLKRRRLDPDLWILDIEDPWGDFTLDAPVLDI